jgi:hypothetical protein
MDMVAVRDEIAFAQASPPLEARASSLTDTRQIIYFHKRSGC